MIKKKFLDEIRDIFRIKHYSYKTEKSYIYWIRRFIFFHNKRHPAEMSEKEIGEFLSYLVVNKRVSASTQNQALNAIVFLYKKVLNKDLKRVRLIHQRDLLDGFGAVDLPFSLARKYPDAPMEWA